MLKKRVLIGAIFIILTITNGAFGEVPQFAFYGEFRAYPFTYAAGDNLRGLTLAGRLSAGVSLKKVILYIAVEEEMHSVTSLENPERLYGAFNILRGSVRALVNINRFLAIEAGLGGGWYRSAFTEYSYARESRNESGIFLACNVHLSFPVRFIELLFLTKLDMFIGKGSFSPYYQGGIRLLFHPLVNWIDIFLEVGAMPLIYKEPPAPIRSGLIMAAIGMAFDIRSRDTRSEMRALRKSYRERHGLTSVSDVSDDEAGTTEETDPALEDLKKRLAEAKNEEEIVLYNVYFIEGKDTILEQSYPVLDTLADFMQDHPETVIEIKGYAFLIHNAEEEFKLCINRSKKIRAYLAEKGIDAERIMIMAGGTIIDLEAHPDMLPHVTIKILEK